MLEGVGGDPEAHAVIFCGSGLDRRRSTAWSTSSTSASRPTSTTAGTCARAIPPDQRPVVFIGPYEHHSNELPWRESIADVVTIREDRDGYVDLAQLRAELDRYADRPLKIGSFSAASNVTGIVSDTYAISRLLHEHGALSFFDFAAAAPYVAIEMDPPDDPLAYKDAVFISPHKFIGGPGRPGVLVARRELFRNRVPSVPGGGTVQYVNPFEHVYLSDIEHREEGGTPAIVESIRAGPRVRLKAAVGVEAIREREHDVHPPGAARAGRPTPRSRSSAATRRTGCRSSRSSSATTGATCTTTSWSRCSTTCSGSSRAAAARAPDRTGTGCWASTSRPRTSSSARSRAAARASSPAGSG